jgi:hypothetical protein
VALALKFLAEGQLAAAEADLYAATATVGIGSIILVNTSGADVNVNILVRKGAGTSRRIFDKDYPIPANESRPINYPMVLENGDELRGYASSANVIDFTVFGFTE